MATKTTDKVQVGDSTTGTSTSTTYKVSSSPIEYGWVCPKCGRANAPWKSFCDCSGPGWQPTWDWLNKPYYDEWWKHVYCDSDTFKVHPVSGPTYTTGTPYTTHKAPSSICHSDSATTAKSNPDSTIYTTAQNITVGGSDYYDNINHTWTNAPHVSNSSTSIDSPWHKYYTLTSDKINDLQNQINNLKETK